MGRIKPKELSENLNKNGGYIPGIKPGEETTKYIKTVEFHCEIYYTM